MANRQTFTLAELSEPRATTHLSSIPSVKQSRGIYQTKKGELFLRGPIPWPWLCVAGRTKGHALHVALALWFYAGLTKSRTVALNLSRLLEVGAAKDSARRGLRALEAAGLVKVLRHAGRKPRVTILFPKLVAKPEPNKGDIV